MISLRNAESLDKCFEEERREKTFSICDTFHYLHLDSQWERGLIFEPNTNGSMIERDEERIEMKLLFIFPH